MTVLQVKYLVNTNLKTTINILIIIGNYKLLNIGRYLQDAYLSKVTKKV